jgi:hypothetical protein
VSRGVASSRLLFIKFDRLVGPLELERCRAGLCLLRSSSGVLVRPLKTCAVALDFNPERSPKDTALTR